jgi:hypothetical protein
MVALQHPFCAAAMVSSQLSGHSDPPVGEAMWWLQSQHSATFCFKHVDVHFSNLKNCFCFFDGGFLRLTIIYSKFVVRLSSFAAIFRI